MNEFLETTETGDAVIAMLLEEQLIDEILVQKVANQINELLQNGGPQHLILDLSLVWIVCSTMLGRLITLNKKVQSAGRTLRLCGVSPQLYEVFAMTKLNKLFAIYDSRQQAIAATQQDGPA